MYHTVDTSNCPLRTELLSPFILWQKPCTVHWYQWLWIENWVCACCVSAGIVFYYSLFQLTVWWFCHEVSIFWKIRFPIHAKTFETSHRVKYVHITMVVVGLALPILPVIVTFTTGDPSGFGMTRFPPILCTSLQKDSTFYSLVLPINILTIIGTPLLIIIFWTIHKVMAVYTHNGAWEWCICSVLATFYWSLRSQRPKETKPLNIFFITWYVSQKVGIVYVFANIF